MPFEIHPADSHAPFEHEIITTPVQVVFAKGKTSIIGGIQMIVCTACGHWIERPMLRKCECIASCHAEARSVYALMEM